MISDTGGRPTINQLDWPDVLSNEPFCHRRSFAHRLFALNDTRAYNGHVASSMHPPIHFFRPNSGARSTRTYIFCVDNTAFYAPTFVDPSLRLSRPLT